MLGPWQREAHFNPQQPYDLGAIIFSELQMRGDWAQRG